MTFKYVSLFSGIGGFEQALNKLGGKCVMASEIDKFANKAYEVLYGEPTVGDVTKVVAEDVPDHDLLVGGFPCQAFSVAGKRLGFEDTRGTLFFEMARIAKAKKPKVILAENVKGLVGHDKGRTLNVIIQTLCDIGYTVDFNVLNSKYFGVPQNRERIFIVAIRDDLVEPEPWKDVEGNTVVPKGKRRIQQLEGVKTFNFDWPPQEEVTTRLRDILEDNVDERFYLSEEKTAKLIAQLNGNAEGEKGRFLIDDQGRTTKELKPLQISPTLRREMHGNEPRVVEPQIEQFTQGDGVSCCIDANYTKGTAPGDVGKGRRTHVIEEVRPVLTPDRETKRQNGRRFKDVGEEMFTLTAQDRHGVAIGNTQKYRIRKLTPRECFRLQGFPDSEFDKLVAAGISDSQLYKMAGNAVTVNVIDAIGRRLLPIIN
jgi:DNA (cytosine-5)-methyltransferase 1